MSDEYINFFLAVTKKEYAEDMPISKVKKCSRAY